MLPAVARTVITQYDYFDGLLQQAVHLLPAEVFTEGSPTKAALKRRVSSLVTVSHDLFEENQVLRETLEGEAKKRTKEVRDIFFSSSNIFPGIVTPARQEAARRSAIQRLGDTQTSVCHEVSRQYQDNPRPHATKVRFGRNFTRGIILFIQTWGHVLILKPHFVLNC